MWQVTDNAGRVTYAGTDSRRALAEVDRLHSVGRVCDPDEVTAMWAAAGEWCVENGHDVTQPFSTPAMQLSFVDAVLAARETVRAQRLGVSMTVVGGDAIVITAEQGEA